MDRNLTTRIDEALLANAHSAAAARGVTVSDIIRNAIDAFVRSGISEQGVMNGNLQFLFAYSMGQISRSEARKSLGVDDPVLTQLLRASGFPPPRASQTDEDAMLDSIRGLRLVSKKQNHVDS